MRTVTTLIFPGFELLDVFGPLEMFGGLPDDFHLSMAARTAGPVASEQGPRVVADRAMRDVAETGILLVPGGPGTRTLVEDAATLDWLRAVAPGAERVLGVCTGSALLARAGILDGRAATTNKLAFDWVAAQGPRTDWRRRARWVADGPVVTSSGVSAGIDMSLAVIGDLCGRAAMERVATEAEYVANTDPDDDPFALMPPENSP